MAKAVLGGIEVEVDEDGFIQEPDKWSKAVAEDIAKTENAFPMGENHWKLVDYSQRLLREVRSGTADPDGRQEDRYRSQTDL